MTTAGGGTPSTQGGTRNVSHPTPSEFVQQPGPSDDDARPYVPGPRRTRSHETSEADTPRDWDATDELGYFYRTSEHDSVHSFFAEPLRDYVSRHADRDVSVLQAGCLAPLPELGIRLLTEDGFRVSVSVADEDTPLTRDVLEDATSSYDDVIIGDLRSVAMPQRAFDVIYCGRLLERVRQVEVVLDHLTGALKPGGLLMIRMADRHAASALLDRTLPAAARKRLWRRRHPDIPGPLPAIYEATVSERGMHSYMLMRGLVVAQHSAEPTVLANPAGLSSSVRVACTAISRLTRGRYGDDHDELLYVIRKPQDRFARVV
jgi:SAM-dependent methyltransferase